MEMDLPDRAGFSGSFNYDAHQNELILLIGFSLKGKSWLIHDMPAA